MTCLLSRACHTPTIVPQEVVYSISAAQCLGLACCGKPGQLLLSLAASQLAPRHCDACSVEPPLLLVCRFGFSVQREIWLQNRKQWTRLFKEIDWTHTESNYYRKWPQEFKYDTSAPKGHLPLTNCLRGTQLFKAILEHPAFDRKGSNGSTPEWMQ